MLIAGIIFLYILIGSVFVGIRCRRFNSKNFWKQTYTDRYKLLNALLWPIYMPLVIIKWFIIFVVDLIE